MYDEANEQLAQLGKRFGYGTVATLAKQIAYEKDPIGVLGPAGQFIKTVTVEVQKQISVDLYASKLPRGPLKQVAPDRFHAYGWDGENTWDLADKIEELLRGD